MTLEKICAHQKVTDDCQIYCQSHQLSTYDCKYLDSPIKIDDQVFRCCTKRKRHQLLETILGSIKDTVQKIKGAYVHFVYGL